MSQPIIPLSRRHLLLGLAAGLGAAAPWRFSRAAEADAPGEELRYAHLKGGDEILLRAAKVLDTPYKVSFSEFATGNLIVEAINANAVDFGVVSDVAPILALQSNARVKFIAALKVDVSNIVVLVPKGSAIASPADLKGKRIGYVRATTSHYFLLKLLDRAGLKISDVTAINLSPSDGRAAFLRGDIDAWSIFYPFANIVANATGAPTLVNAEGYLPGQFVLVAAADSVAQPDKHARITDFLKRLRRAYQWGDQHRPEWADAAAEALRLPHALVDQWLQGSKTPYTLGPVGAAAIANMQDTADTFAKAGLIGPTDVRPYWDWSFNAAFSES